MKNIINLNIITGPTATGKSELAIECAKRMNGEIVSADSMQIYRGMDIGTAKQKDFPVPHHMIDLVSPLDEYSVALYKAQATEVIVDISDRGKTPILAGGTGLYINSLIYNTGYQTKKDGEISMRLNNYANDVGIIKLYEKLQSVDPVSASKINPNDKRRIIRALEIYEITGEPMRRDQCQPSDIFSPKIVVLNMDRNVLYDRIERRVDKMLKDGLLNEVNGLAGRCGKQAEQGIGYKELFAYLNKECTLDEAINKIKKNSRNYAKRQLTWFRRYPDALWLDAEMNKEQKILKTVYYFSGR